MNAPDRTTPKRSEALTDGDFWLDDPAAFEDPATTIPTRASTSTSSSTSTIAPPPAAPRSNPFAGSIPPPGWSGSLPAEPHRVQGPELGNRRQFERHAVDRPAKVTEMDEFGNPGPCWLCRLVDISRGGLGVRSKRMVHMGRGVLIELDGATPAATKLLYGVVRQSRYVESEGYAVGVQFRSVPTTSAVRNWLSMRGLRL
jgi:hypothetical protein